MAEIKYAELTNDKQLRAPVFMHLREDVPSEQAKPNTVVEIKGESNKKPARSAAKLGGKQKPAAAAADTGLVTQIAEQLEAKSESMILNVGDHEINVSNLNRIFWPAQGRDAEVTKRDYLSYLARVSPFILPHLLNRPITLVRMPEGINGERFYQKHWPHKLPPYVETVELYSEHSKDDGTFMLCNNLPTLLWLGQVADLEIHVVHSRVVLEPDNPDLSTKCSGSLKNIENCVMNYPDFLVLDLDPYLYSGKEATGAEPELHKKGFRQATEVALWLKDMLDELGLETFVKTSGRTGLHIYVPIERTVDYETVRACAQVIGHKLLEEHPKEITMDWAVRKRTGKVFFDHNMNARGKTLASAYSLRVHPEATVSMPLHWDELKSVYPTDFSIRRSLERLHEHGDVWSDILEHRNDLAKIHPD